MRILRTFVAEERKFRPGDEQMLTDSGLEIEPFVKEGLVDPRGEPAPERLSPVELAAKGPKKVKDVPVVEASIRPLRKP